MNTLVTGGGGFLGRHVVRQLLTAGHCVKVVGRNNYPDLESSGAECYQVDICDAEAIMDACKNVDEVYHVAALAGVWGDWNDYYRINFLGTVNVINACRAQGVSRLIYTSSPSVVFDGQSQKGLDEQSPYPTRWLAHYPKSKMLGEKAVLEANCAVLKTVALRPHLIWGPGDHHLIPRIVERARKGQLAQVGDGENLVDVIYVENAAQAHLKAAEDLRGKAQSAGKAYFLGQDEPVNLWQFIEEILIRAHAPRVKKRLPFSAAYLIGWGMETLYKSLRIKSEPRMTRFVACQLSTDHYYDHKRAKNDFGYHPEVSVSQGLDRLFAKVQP